MRRLVAPLLLLLAAPMVVAQTAPVVLSPAPQQVGVTLYRDPDRGERKIDRDDPSSFALITETRTITLPPGVATIRFEGVASGIVPQSAIMFGTDPRERNRDAALLSQAGLVDAFTGQRVVLRRTNPATGETEERATIRSAADRLIIDTPRGAEAVYCSGLAQTLIYPGAPATLAAKPVLSMTTKDQPGGTVTITLAYIATGFDWDATYVGTLDEAGARLDLFAWLTMASADETSFVDATTAAVAGRINRSDETRDDTARAAISAARRLNTASQCWPAGTTSDVPYISIPPPPPSPPMMMEMAGEDIVVTGAAVRRQAMAPPMAITAEAENLSDLKLYRVPIPVTVAAKSQKQVAFLADRRIDGSLIYRSRLSFCKPDDPEMLFRFRNRKRDGLGEPLPAGKVILYQMGARGRQLVGEATLADKTIDEEVDLVFGGAQGVTIDTESQQAKDGTHYTVTVRNAQPFPVRYEMEFMNDPNAALRNVSVRLASKPGKRMWTAALAPNSEAKISYVMSECR
ncbi:hypothetical protein M2336_001267 [Sphingobium sp. B1D7B]|uniref:DUF4139 domain-containing protein n=1 Tax=Sphingobium sp. B1D7B TaxID=2940578 RepID=UPI0022242D73|nr:hypothetical protein [Sphingobium sp. B1D7B]MCW2404638.1 hypothetical protein [Sphingobium sp. B1D7B]